jgi:hypothetical protein
VKALLIVLAVLLPMVAFGQIVDHPPTCPPGVAAIITWVDGKTSHTLRVRGKANEALNTEVPKGTTVTVTAKDDLKIFRDGVRTHTELKADKSVSLVPGPYQIQDLVLERYGKKWRWSWKVIFSFDTTLAKKQ